MEFDILVRRLSLSPLRPESVFDAMMSTSNQLLDTGIAFHVFTRALGDLNAKPDTGIALTPRVLRIPKVAGALGLLNAKPDTGIAFTSKESEYER